MDWRMSPVFTTENWTKYTPDDHKTWETLFQRQTKILEKHGASAFFHGIEKLQMYSHEIPKLSTLNAYLQKETGFTIVPVKGLVPPDIFFPLLAERKFPASSFIRPPEKIDFLDGDDPDIFHDVFGHVPFLADPIFAEFMFEFGLKGLEALKYDRVEQAARLYWYAVEFGLIKENNEIKVVGAAISSSLAETLYAANSPTPERVPYDLKTILNTPYCVESSFRQK